jgi:hypothetical protein
MYAVEEIDMDGWDYAVVNTSIQDEESQHPIECLCDNQEAADKIAALLNKG